MKRQQYVLFAIGLAILFISIALFTLAMGVSGQAQPGLAAAPDTGGLVVAMTPAARVSVDGQPWAGEPVQAGPRMLRLAAPGYVTVERRIAVAAGQTVTVRGTLADNTPPRAAMQANPTQAEVGTPVDVDLDLADAGSGLARFDFSLDGRPLLTRPLTGTTSATYTLRLVNLDAGLHRLTLAAVDGAGNVITPDLYLEMTPAADTPNVAAAELPPPGERRAVTDTLGTPLSGEQQPVTAAPGTQPPGEQRAVTAAQDTKSGDTAAPVPAPAAGVAPIREESLTISAYAYEQALSGGPRPTLDVSKMGPARPKTYRAVILENDALRLTFLPELGGRLYQITDKATGRGLLYNNPVVKPTRWGPPDMNWWLAVGGMEWAFPVFEHGYAWGVPWAYTTALINGGSVITLSHFDAPTNLAAQVVLVLPPKGRSFTIAPALINRGSSPASAQLWLNAAFPAGPGLKLDLPAAAVKVHSAGQPEGYQAGQILPWRPEMGQWGQWKTWFGAFAMPVTSGVINIRGAGDGPGLQRSFDPAQSPGVKLFTWGTDAPLGEFEGRPYLELWGGLTLDFDTAITLGPGQTRGWVEMWTVAER